MSKITRTLTRVGADARLSQFLGYVDFAVSQVDRREKRIAAGPSIFAGGSQKRRQGGSVLRRRQHLVSRSFENSAFGEGTPVLGMARWIEKSAELKKLVDAGKAEVILSPNTQPEGNPSAARSQEHGDFDDDRYTVLATLKRVLGSVDSAKYGAGVSPAPKRTPKGGARAAAISISAAGTGVAARATPPQELSFHRSSSSLRSQREEVDRLSKPRSAW